MAVFNEILVAHYNRALQKLLGLKGGPPSPQLSSEIMAVLKIPLGTEFRFLDSWNRYAALGNIAGVAAQNSLFLLRNPSGSNVIAVVEKLTIITNSTGGGAVFQANPSADLANAITTIPLDNRQGISGNASALRCSSSTLAGNPIGTNQIIFQANSLISQEQILTENQELPVPPGAGLYVNDQTANERLLVSIWWRERFLEESERQ